MPNFLLVLATILMTQVCWGVYGPMIRTSTADMHGNHLLPFILVGVAYFLVAVVVPIAILRSRGEKGHWSTTGVVWSFSSGVSAAIGTALGIILAFHNGGSPLVVMPLVFGGAPVVNTFYSMYLAKTYREASPIFYAGLILVIAGAASVLYFNPAMKSAQAAPAAAATVDEATAPAEAPPTERSRLGRIEDSAVNTFLVLSFVAMTIVTWGIYGPILHNGQAKMGGSRMRPFLCVGLAYFLIAVVVPVVILVIRGESLAFTPSGTMWGLLGGSVGAVEALGIILAFTFGGKPIYVMPLVFGGAPVVNTLVSMMMVSELGDVSPLFYAGLIVVIAGSATVLIFAPKPPAHAK